MTEIDYKERLKELRQKRASIIEEVHKKLKEQQNTVSSIKKAIQNKELTVPEISSETKIPSSKVVWYLMTLKAYGEIEEGLKDGNYFRYRMKSNSNKVF